MNGGGITKKPNRKNQMRKPILYKFRIPNIDNYKV